MCLEIWIVVPKNSFLAIFPYCENFVTMHTDLEQLQLAMWYKIYFPKVRRKFLRYEESSGVLVGS